jgi:hypothetical protein
MNDLQSRITAYVDASVPSVDIDLLVEQLAETDKSSRPLRSIQTPGSWRQRRWAPILAGAIMVLLLIGGAALLNRPADAPVISTPEETTPSPTTSLLSPTTTSAPIPVPAAGSWTSHEIFGNSLIGDDLVAGWVTAGGPGFVATGNTWTATDVWGRGQIWTSTDGSSWDWVADEDRTLFVEGYWPVGGASTPSGLIVLGSNNRQGGTVIWRSSEGTDWSLVATGEPPLDGDNFTDGLPLASGGYLLYGAPADCSLTSDRCTPSSAPRLATSSDGLTWQPITTPVTFTAITQTGTGALLAAQRRASEPTMWISQDDGRTWQRHGPDNSIELGQPSVQVSTLEETPYGLIAAGVDQDRKPTLWISEDGKAFTPSLQLRIGSEVGAIAVGRGWVVAVGSDEIPQVVEGVNHGPAIWVSDDGRQWQSVSLAETYRGGGGLHDIAYSDGVFVAVGQHRAEIGGEALVLRWEPLRN